MRTKDEFRELVSEAARTGVVKPAQIAAMKLYWEMLRSPVGAANGVSVIDRLAADSSTPIATRPFEPRLVQLVLNDARDDSPYGVPTDPQGSRPPEPTRSQRVRDVQAP